jgi:hypothetical protein
MKHLSIITTVALALSSAVSAPVSESEWVARTNSLETFVSKIDGSIYGADLERGKAVALGNVILADGTAQGAMIIPLEDYVALTNEIEYVRYRFYYDEDYRVFRHGKQKMKEVNIKALTYLQTYADGTVYTNSIPKKERGNVIASDTNKVYTTRGRPVQHVKREQDRQSKKPKGMSPRRWKLEQEIEARRREPVINKTMNYDPTTKTFKEVK